MVMGDLAREQLRRAFDPEVETLVKDRMREFAHAIIVSIDRNADTYGVTAQMLEEASPEEVNYRSPFTDYFCCLTSNSLINLVLPISTKNEKVASKHATSPWLGKGR